MPHKLPYKIIIVFFILLCGFVYAMWDVYRPIPTSQVIPEATKPIKASEEKQKVTTVPNSEFTDLKGNTYNLHDFKGKIVVLNMWATWCPPCIEEFPSLLKLAAMRKDDLVFIALSADRTEDLITAFLGKLDEDSKAALELDNVIIVHDKNQTVSYNDFQSIKYPETFIIDRQSRIRTKIAGGWDWTAQPALDILAEIDAKQ